MKWGTALAISVVVGFFCAELLCRLAAARDALGQLCGKGHLVALADGAGIYEADVDRAAAEVRYRGQALSNESEAGRLRESVFSQLANEAIVEEFATKERIAASIIERELGLLQSQFRDRHTFLTALKANDLSENKLRKMISQNLRGRLWLEQRVKREPHGTTEEARHLYEAHPENYLQPVRLRATHLFLAAPPETPPEIVELKKTKIEMLAKEITEGRDFLEIIATESEDEASKMHGGDLGFFAAYRMPEDFFAEAEKLRPGEISKPVRTALGFHVIQKTDSKPAQQLTFDEVREEIENSVKTEKRPIAMQALDVDLKVQARIFRPVSDLGRAK